MNAFSSPGIKSNNIYHLRRNSSSTISLSLLEHPNSNNLSHPPPAMRSSFGIPPHRTQLPPRATPSRMHTSLQNSPYFTHFPLARRRMSCNSSLVSCMLISGLAMTAVMTIIFLFSKSSSSSLPTTVVEKTNKKYAIIIDAGSSGSRLHIFWYLPSPKGMIKLPQVNPTSKSLKIRPGLSSFANRVEEAGESLMPLIDFARKYVPLELQPSTPLYLMATAGLRRLENSTCMKILSSCEKQLRASGFNFSQDGGAVVIPGMWEGVYAWVAANYAANLLGTAPDKTNGIIELGGASAQVTFVPDKIDGVQVEHIKKLTLGGVHYSLFTHSFLNYGQEAAAEGLAAMLQQKKTLTEPVLDPCKHHGYDYSVESVVQPSLREITGEIPQFTAQGNFSLCRRTVGEFLSQGNEACKNKNGCAFGSVYVPPLRGDFLATENFFHTAKFLELSPSAVLADMESAGKSVCSVDWEDFKKAHPGKTASGIAKYCFSAAYAVALLHDALGVDLYDSRVKFRNEVNMVPLDWPLGALVIKLSSSDIEIQSMEGSGEIFFDDKVVALFMFSALVFVAVGVWSAKRYRKTPMTTIYDLEKGRYFTTVSRSYLR